MNTLKNLSCLPIRFQGFQKIDENGFLSLLIPKTTNQISFVCETILNAIFKIYICYISQSDFTYLGKQIKTDLEQCLIFIYPIGFQGFWKSFEKEFLTVMLRKLSNRNERIMICWLRFLKCSIWKSESYIKANIFFLSNYRISLS